MLKLFRRLESGINPDLEVGALPDRAAASRTSPRCAGSLEYRARRGEPTALAIAAAVRPQRGRRLGAHARPLGDFADALPRPPTGAGAGRRAPARSLGAAGTEEPPRARAAS